MVADIFKIYTGDYSKEGYEQGIDDGKEGRTKNKLKFFKAINPISYIWNFNNAYESFMQNYNKGYLDGQRVANQVYSTKSTQGVNMNNQSYEYHLELLRGLEANLKNLRSYVENISQKYQQQIGAMYSAGFFDNYISTLQGKYQEFHQKIDELERLIELHNSKIAKQKAAIEELIQKARG